MKRWQWLLVCAAAWPALGCGGNVVVDGDVGGSGGAGGGTGSTTNGQVGPACAAVCEAFTTCGGGVPANPPCAEQCAPVVELAEKSGCAVQTTAFYDCIAASPDICTEVGCNTEINDYVNCISTYCNANPDECDADP